MGRRQSFHDQRIATMAVEVPLVIGLIKIYVSHETRGIRCRE